MKTAILILVCVLCGAGISGSTVKALTGSVNKVSHSLKVK